MNKKEKFVTYIIQARFVRICKNEKDYGKYFKQMFFPSIHNEHKQPPMVIRL